MTDSLPAAVLWDLDGTLVDTEPYWLHAETALVEAFGGTWSRAEAMGMVGQGMDYTARVLQAKGVALGEEEIIRAMTAQVLEQVRTTVPWQPGARELLAALRDQGIPTALVTMSRRSLATHIAAATGGTFDVIVGGEDVANSKPHPEPYLTAAALLGVGATECVAIEDSRPGIASAVAAGAITIGVPHLVPIEPSPEYTVWPTLRDRSVADLAAIVASRRLA